MLEVPRKISKKDRGVASLRWFWKMKSSDTGQPELVHLLVSSSDSTRTSTRRCRPLTALRLLFKKLANKILGNSHLSRQCPAQIFLARIFSLPVFVVITGIITRYLIPFFRVLGGRRRRSIFFSSAMSRRYYR